MVYASKICLWKSIQSQGCLYIFSYPLPSNRMQSYFTFFQFSSAQSLSRVRLFATPWTIACQVSLSITNSWSLLKLMSIEAVMPSNHLILYHPLLLPCSIIPNIRVFSNEWVLHIRWPNTAYYHLFNPAFLNIGTIDNLGQDISFHKTYPVHC